jgi:hypothetical protein
VAEDRRAVPLEDTRHGISRFPKSVRAHLTFCDHDAMWTLIMIGRSIRLQAEARTSRSRSRFLKPPAKEARAVSRDARPIQGGSSDELRSVIDLIADAALCIEASSARRTSLPRAPRRSLSEFSAT